MRQRSLSLPQDAIVVSRCPGESLTHSVIDRLCKHRRVVLRSCLETTSAQRTVQTTGGILAAIDYIDLIQARTDFGKVLPPCTS